LRNRAVFGGASRREDNDASRFSPLIVFTNSQLVPTRAFRLVTPSADTVSYSVDYLHENTASDQIIGVSVPRDSSFMPLDSSSPYLFFRIVLSPNSNCQNLQVIAMKLTSQTEFSATAIFRPLEILHEENMKYSLVFQYYQD
jgi:hypothetical protein